MTAAGGNSCRPPLPGNRWSEDRGDLEPELVSGLDALVLVDGVALRRAVPVVSEAQAGIPVDDLGQRGPEYRLDVHRLPFPVGGVSARRVHRARVRRLAVARDAEARA